MSVDASAGIRLHDVDETKQVSQMKPVFNAALVEHGAGLSQFRAVFVSSCFNRSECIQ